MRRPSLVFASLLLTATPHASAQLTISEVIAIAVADERGQQPEQFEDEDGHLSDIIELHNAGDESIALSGYGLTDNRNDLDKWTFSSNQRIGPGEYLKVFASAKNKTGLFASIPHTNFKLSRSGEYLALVNPEGEVLDSFDPLPKMYDRVSYGHEGYMIRATPGEPNAAAVAPPSTGVKFSVKSRPFFDPFTVELTAKDLPEGAWIGYTSDGSPPEESLFSPPKRYSGPIEISETTQIRARIFEDGKLPSEIETETYVQFAEEYRDWSSNLPVIIIENDDKGLPSKARFHEAAMLILEPSQAAEGEEKRTTLTHEADLATRSGIRTRGSSTSGNAKRSLAVESWYDDANWADKAISPLGLPAESDWVLSGRMQFDRALMRNPFAYEVFRQMGHWAPRTRFVEVFMNVDGDEVDTNDYFGVYAFMERIKIGDDRLQIEQSNGSTAGGFIFKDDRTASGDKTFSVAGRTHVWVEPQGDGVTNQQNSAIKKFLDDAVDAMQSDDPENPETGYRAYIDTRSWIDEYLVRTLTRDPDGMRLSTYLHKQVNGKVNYGPIWDFDRTMGCDSDDRARVVNQWVSYFPTHGWYRYLLGSGVNRKGGEAVMPEFWQEWIDRYHELRRTVWADENFHAIIDSMAAEIREAQERNFARWTGTRPDAGNVKDYNNDVPGWEGEIVHLKGWLTARMEWMDEQFTIQPRLEGAGVVASGESVRVRSGGTLFTPQDVYYTTDGTDPRMPGGEVNPNAIKAGANLTATEDMSLILRATREGLWSGPIKAAIVVDGIPASAENLLVSEIMYHPREGQPSEQASGHFHEDLFEFIELTNVGSQSMYLGDLTFTEGVDFDFSVSDIQLLEPGQRVVLTSDLEAFTARYGADLPVGGAFVGKLSNAGEHLTLMRGEEIIQSFAYNDRSPWPTTPDNYGFSLTLRQAKPGIDLSDASQWTVDVSSAGGSPGSEGQTPALVVVNEVLANSGASQSDAIEIHNAGSEEIDLSGWWLTDDADEPQKFGIPAGSVISAGGYLVFYQDNDNDPTNNDQLPEEFFGNAFGLNSEGDRVWLFSATPEGELTGYRDGFQFGDTDEGETIGRYVTEDGEVHDVIESAPSLGSTNIGPLISPVVITEIMYHPPAEPQEGAEYVEIFNRTNAPVALHDPAHPDHVWRVSGIDYVFPAGTSLDAGEVALVVGVDPEDFRANYGLSQDVRIFGPFSGRLNNAGESLRLQRPGTAFDDDGTLNFRYITADRVDYDRDAPWPVEADGSGASIERLDPNQFANQVSAWAGANGGTPGSVAFSSGGGGGGGEPGNSGEAIAEISSTASGLAFLLPEGATYDIEYSSDLETWTVIATGVTGRYEDSDASRQEETGGYYRGIVK